MSDNNTPEKMALNRDSDTTSQSYQTDTLDDNRFDDNRFDDNLKQDHLSQGIEQSLAMILDVPVTLSMELGRTRMSIRELLRLTQGSVVKMDRPAGEPLDLLVNGCLIARGEVVVVNERFGARITHIINPDERVKKVR